MIEKTVGRSPLVVQAEPTPHAPHAALLVDFDNVTMGIRSDLQTQLRKLLNSDIIRGKVSVQRAYADWRRYPQYIVPLTEASIDLIFAPAVGANKKNATDIRLAIDALELVFTRPEIGTFILLSGDSDFSALVLKLKEYGKFVIGVGIRESSSDLLVQNCDEYYSYNELTGLARTGEGEIVRHDPWELAVEAVQKMLRNGDVMRSDRLKQVMQSIDPSFDEKDAGCNRFSKFVVEAEKRGLLRLTKMENGQHAVDVGPNANVRIDHDTTADKQPSKSATTSTASSQRRRRTTRSRTDKEAKVRTLTLSESIDLLKRALMAAGAVGDEATVADRARERMVEIHGNESDPIFETKRFQRLLRQAHDAAAIELIKSGDDDYMLKLSAAAVVEMESKKVDTDPTAAESAEPREETSDAAEATAEPKRTTRKKTTTARKSSRSRARVAAKEQPDEEIAASTGADEKPAGEEEEKPKRTTRKKTTTTKKTTRSRKKTTTKDETPDEVAVAGSETVADDAVPSEEKEKKKPAARRKKTTRTRTKKTDEVEAAEVGSEDTTGDAPVKSAPAPKLNPRYRKGSKSAAPKPPVKDEAPETDVKVAEPATPVLKVSTGPRSLGVRSGSRGAKRPEAEPKPPREELKAPKEEPKPKAETPKPKQKPKTETPKPEQKSSIKPEKKPETPRAKPKPEPEPKAKQEPSPSEPDEDGAGLFRKVTAAFQRAMGTGKEDAE